MKEKKFLKFLRRSWQKKYFKKDSQRGFAILPKSSKDCPFWDWEQFFGSQGILLAHLTMFATWIFTNGDNEDRRYISHQIWEFRRRIQKAEAVEDESDKFVLSKLREKFGKNLERSFEKYSADQYSYQFNKELSEDIYKKITDSLNKKSFELWEEIYYCRDKEKAEEKIFKELKQFSKNKFKVEILSFKKERSYESHFFTIFKNFDEPVDADDEWRRMTGRKMNRYYNHLIKRASQWEQKETLKRWQLAFNYLTETMTNQKIVEEAPFHNLTLKSDLEKYKGKIKSESKFPRMTNWWD